MPTPLEQWVDQSAKLTQPQKIVWCDGSETEYQRLIQEMLASGTLMELNQKEYPGCYLHRSDPSDVARTEHLTFVCTSKQEDAGPNNNWMPPAEAKETTPPRGPCSSLSAERNIFFLARRSHHSLNQLTRSNALPESA